MESIYVYYHDKATCQNYTVDITAHSLTEAIEIVKTNYGPKVFIYRVEYRRPLLTLLK
jgi:hypothetical protein